MNAKNLQMRSSEGSGFQGSRRSLKLLCACVALTGAVFFKQAALAEPERPVIGIEHTELVRVVFQITGERMSDGVHRDLLTLKKQHADYIAAGIDPEDLQIAAVVHGAAADYLLTDEAWNTYRGETGGNPNRDLLTKLRRKGVSVELCDVRRVQNGWAKSDIHPDVRLVSNAYQRLIDLQINGYAYIKL